jgi:hydroxymethylpyrimidine pyrophosphatase-like HAD family hydrolase
MFAVAFGWVHQVMREMLIAVDVDGTLYDGFEVAPEATEALRRAYLAGHTIVIVTGRRWEDLKDIVPTILELTDCVVCEEGGVLVDVGTGEITLLSERVDNELVAALRLAGVADLDVGLVAIGAPIAALAPINAVLDRLQSEVTVVQNKGSVSLKPFGCDKGTGLLAAVADLHLEGVPILAIGDAANDLAMFAVATVAVGVANCDAAVRAAGIEVTKASVGLGVAEALGWFLPR